LQLFADDLDLKGLVIRVTLRHTGHVYFRCTSNVENPATRPDLKHFKNTRHKNGGGGSILAFSYSGGFF